MVQRIIPSQDAWVRDPSPTGSLSLLLEALCFYPFALSAGIYMMYLFIFSIYLILQYLTLFYLVLFVHLRLSTYCYACSEKFPLYTLQRSTLHTYQSPAPYSKYIAHNC